MQKPPEEECKSKELKNFTLISKLYYANMIKKIRHYNISGCKRMDIL